METVNMELGGKTLKREILWKIAKHFEVISCESVTESQLESMNMKAAGDFSIQILRVLVLAPSTGNQCADPLLLKLHLHFSGVPG